MRIGDDINSCLSRVQVEQLLAGERNDAAMVAHLNTCTVCQAKAEAIRRNNQLLEELRLTREEADAGLKGAAFDAIADYEMIREIHRGAQGVVFEAVQVATKRRVAVKIIGRGRFATTRQRLRFDREIEIVASLRHPNIAMLYESGATSDGSAFFAMEYVDGTALLEYRTWRAAAPRDAARLFLKICLAVGHAHQLGVIHRDLKPGNIMVDRDGEPRVLDFGLACIPRDQATNDISAEVVFAGTFAYASPEQLAGRADETDIRSDVYSLGLILYELLTGEQPNASCATLADLIAARRDLAPVPPRTIRRDVDRDLETIVLKALACDPARRYRSAGELAEDLERYLEGRPILSRQDSMTYVLFKHFQRRKRLVIPSIATAFVLIALLLFGAFQFVQHEREQTKSSDTLIAFQQVLETADPLSGLSTDTRLDVFLGHVGGNVQSYLSDQPEIAASIHSTLGQIALNMADYPSAESHFSEALALREQALDDDDPAIADSLHNLGRALFYLGEYARAAQLYRDALQRRTASVGNLHPDVANTMSHLASCLRRMGDTVQAEALLIEALRIRRSLPDAAPADIAASLNNLGSLLMNVGRLEDALVHFDESLSVIRQANGPNDWRVAHALSNRAACLNRMQQHDEAEKELLHAHVIWSSVVDEGHPALARVQLELARTHIARGRLDRAESMARTAIGNMRMRLGDQHPELADALDFHGFILAQHKRFDEAAVSLEESLSIRLASQSTVDALLGTLMELSRCHQAAGRLDDAERVLLDGVRVAEDAECVALMQIVFGELIGLYEKWNRPEDARIYREKIVRSKNANDASMLGDVSIQANEWGD